MMKPEAGHLAFRFHRQVVQRDVLPFRFGGRETSDTPVPVAPPKPPPKPSVGNDWLGGWSAQRGGSLCLQADWHIGAAAQSWAAEWTDTGTVSGCLNVAVNPLAALRRIFVSVSGAVGRLHRCWQAKIAFAPKLAVCATTEYAAGTLLVHAETAYWRSVHLLNDSAVLLPTARHVQGCFSEQSDSSHLSGCLKTATGHSMQPPCEHYPIPIDDTPREVAKRCKTPPSERIHFHFRRRRLDDDSAHIPLPFTCGSSKAQIPVLDSYMICNEINAQLADGTPLELLSLNIQADTGGYCWQADLTVPPESFAKIKFGQPEKDAITVFINGERFDFMAEDYRDNRQFPRKTYTVTGRSKTALLGADYAVLQTGLVSRDLYARQIADNQLKFLNFNINDWQIADWLVPKNVYSLTDKTPIAVLQDIAQAAGGFVCSHPYLPQLDVRPLWRVPAWTLQQTAPDVQVPGSAIVSISGSLHISRRCHAVSVSATHNAGKAANVYRRGLEQVPRASDLSHALYTDHSVCEAAGVAALSHTGNHKTETVKLPCIPKYGLNRAELGQIWRFDESAVSWRGVVKGVQVSVEMNGDVPVIYQTLNVDRYTDI